MRVLPVAFTTCPEGADRCPRNGLMTNIRHQIHCIFHAEIPPGSS